MRLLPALHRPDADQAALGQPHEDVVPTLAGCLDARVLEQPHHLGTGQAPVGRQLGGQQLGTALEEGLAEPELLDAASLGSRESRSAQREQPANILGRREVDRPAHQPRAQDPALLDRTLDALDGAVAYP